MLKWIVSFIIIICATYIGTFLKKHFKRRATFYSDYEKFISFCYERISSSLTPIDELKGSFPSDKDFQAFLRGERVDILSKKEKELLDFTIEQIGKRDCENTLSFLSKEREGALKLKEKSNEEVKKKGDLYFKLSIIVGLAIALVI